MSKRRALSVMGPYDFLAAVRCGRRATRRGDIDEAERWYRLAEKAIAISQRLSAQQYTDARIAILEGRAAALERGDIHPRYG